MTGLSGNMGGVITAVMLILFVGIWMWSWSSRRKPTFDEMSRLPLEDDNIKDINEESV